MFCCQSLLNIKSCCWRPGWGKSSEKFGKHEFGEMTKLSIFFVLCSFLFHTLKRPNGKNFHWLVLLKKRLPTELLVQKVKMVVWGKYVRILLTDSIFGLPEGNSQHIFWKVLLKSEAVGWVSKNKAFQQKRYRSFFGSPGTKISTKKWNQNAKFTCFVLSFFLLNPIWWRK